MKMVVTFCLFIFLFLKSYAQMWIRLGEGMDNHISALIFYDGKLYAGGLFTTVDGKRTKSIAVWNGASWDAIDEDLSGNILSPVSVYALCVYNGSLYAGGANFIAKFNGRVWDLQRGEFAVTHFIVFNKRLYASGSFPTNSYKYPDNVAIWDGRTWLPLGEGAHGSVYTLASYKGDIYMAGDFDSVDGRAIHNIAKWDGAKWISVGGETNHLWVISALEEYNGALYVGGNSIIQGDRHSALDDIAMWNGEVWLTVGEGLNGGIVGELAIYQGKIVAGGGFANSFGNHLKNLAQWDGVKWTKPGPDFEEMGSNFSISAISVNNDTLYVATSDPQVNGRGVSTRVFRLSTTSAH